MNKKSVARGVGYAFGLCLTVCATITVVALTVKLLTMLF